MDIITICVNPTMIEVVKGRAKGAKLKYQAPGLEIYLVGRVTVPRRAAVSHMAMECALERHIPLISLKAYGWV